MDNYQVAPKKFAKIIAIGPGSWGNPDPTGAFETRSEAGAAKFISLKQNGGGGGGTLIRSNLPISGDPQSITTQTSELSFFLGCITAGVLNTNLPEDCDCARPLHIYYEYTTNLRIKAQKRNCIWSKGAEASAEDWAYVGVYHGKTGNITPVAAGRATFNTSCSSNWNPNFWIKFLDMVSPLLQYYITTLDPNSGNQIPTTSQINQFVSGLQTLIQTPFAINDNNGCIDLERQAALVTGSKTYTLAPNSPIRVSLFSSYYLRTRGYGCWRAEAGVASDYYLLGVVESLADPINDECCTKKYANYIVGSQSGGTTTITFPLNAVNNIPNRLGRVGFFLSIFGGWEGLPTVPGSGVVVLTHEFDNRLLGPSCIRGQNDERKGNRLSKMVNKSPKIDFSVFPSEANDILNIQVENEIDDNVKISIFNMNGQFIKAGYFDELESGIHLLNMDVSSIPKGIYILQCESNTQRKNFKILIH